MSAEVGFLRKGHIEQRRHLVAAPAQPEIGQGSSARYRVARLTCRGGDVDHRRRFCGSDGWPAIIVLLGLVVASASASASARDELGTEFPLAKAREPIEQTWRAGRFHQSVGTRSRDTQGYYDQGLGFLYAYQWIFAARSFHAALRLDSELAMAELGLAKAYQGAQAFDEAERWLQRVDPVFKPLWELPEFQKRMAEVKAEMAGQLANLREMERNGELAAIPRSKSNPH